MFLSFKNGESRLAPLTHDADRTVAGAHDHTAPAVGAGVNRYCPTASPVNHGPVTLVLVLNRLVAPCPLYRVMDWLASTI